MGAFYMELLATLLLAQNLAENFGILLPKTFWWKVLPGRLADLHGKSAGIKLMVDKILVDWLQTN